MFVVIIIECLLLLLPGDVLCSDRRHPVHLVSREVSACEDTLWSGTSYTPETRGIADLALITSFIRQFFVLDDFYKYCDNKICWTNYNIAFLKFCSRKLNTVLFVSLLWRPFLWILYLIILIIGKQKMVNDATKRSSWTMIGFHVLSTENQFVRTENQFD